MSLMKRINVYNPYSNLLYTFSLNDDFFMFGAILNKKTSIEMFETELRHFISDKIGFSKSDKGAKSVNNMQLLINAINSLFNGISVYIWSLGICFLLSNMIGVTKHNVCCYKRKNYRNRHSKGTSGYTGRCHWHLYYWLYQECLMGKGNKSYAGKKLNKVCQDGNKTKIPNS